MNRKDKVCDLIPKGLYVHGVAKLDLGSVT
jgi:hypothetical protein